MKRVIKAASSAEITRKDVLEMLNKYGIDTTPHRYEVVFYKWADSHLHPNPQKFIATYDGDFLASIATTGSDLSPDNDPFDFFLDWYNTPEKLEKFVRECSEYTAEDFYEARFDIESDQLDTLVNLDTGEQLADNELYVEDEGYEDEDELYLY